MSDYKTRVDHMTARLKNHPVVAFLIVLGLTVIAISTFTDAASRIAKLAREFWPTNAVEATVNAQVVRLRWSSSSFWHPNQNMEYANELRLPLSFNNLGATPSIIRQVRVLMDSGGHKLTWEGTYEADNLPPVSSAPDAQIQERRTQLLPFALSERNPIVSKTIDFVPIDHPKPLKWGTYKSILQVKHNSSKEWLNLSNFTFTVPSDFKLHGRDPSGAEFSAYDYWQVFELIHEK